MIKVENHTTDHRVTTADPTKIKCGSGIRFLGNRSKVGVKKRVPIIAESYVK